MISVHLKVASLKLIAQNLFTGVGDCFMKRKHRRKLLSNISTNNNKYTVSDFSSVDLYRSISLYFL